MTLIIPDNLLKEANLDERTLAIELACHLFNTQRLTISQARRLAGISRSEFEDELRDRHIPIYRYTQEMVDQDLASIAKLNQGL